MPSYRHHEMGDLYVNLSVAFPDSIPIEKIPLLEQALPPRKALPKLKKDVELEDVVMVSSPYFF
jgi:DnaJ homolog subfamily A member 2